MGYEMLANMHIVLTLEFMVSSRRVYVDIAVSLNIAAKFEDFGMLVVCYCLSA